MITFISRWRIGEKIIVSFGIVGILFLGVIWQYHQSLVGVIEDYEHLYATLDARKTYALEIRDSLAEAQRAEKDFLILRKEQSAATVASHLEILFEKSDALSEVDQESRMMAQKIRGLATDYKYGFLSVVDAWEIKGLNHNSGLQGKFREKAHELQQLSGYFNVDRLYYQLLQIRRGEKDLALRNETLYRSKVNELIKGFRSLVDSSQLRMSETKALLEEISVYEKTFASYADTVLADEDIRGGKGPFRQAAHRIEAILDAHYIQDLETLVLQLRRREKDYLLRQDAKYVEMVQEIAQTMRKLITTSSVSFDDKKLLVGLLDNYEKEFLNLVEQDNRLVKLTLEMNTAAEHITPLVKQNADQALQLLADNVRQIADSSQMSVRISLFITVGATILGLFFIVAITLNIVRPVRKMAGILDELTFKVPSDRIPTLSDSRDEINAMGESLNTLIEHRSRFLEWWKTSMDEVKALRELDAAKTELDINTAQQALRTAALMKIQQIGSIHEKLDRNTDDILEVAVQLRNDGGTVTRTMADKLEHSVNIISSLIEVLKNGSARKTVGT